MPSWIAALSLFHISLAFVSYALETFERHFREDFGEERTAILSRFLLAPNVSSFIMF